MIDIGPIVDRPIGKPRTPLRLRLMWWHLPRPALLLGYLLLWRDRGDAAAIATVAWAYRELRQYERSLPFLDVLGQHQKASRAAPKNPGRDIEISCNLWMAGDRQRAIELMQTLVTGMLKGKLAYGDVAGGVSQGLLLQYMGASAGQPEIVEAAQNYLRNRATKPRIKAWPGPVALHCLGELAFEELIERITGSGSLDEAINIANSSLLKRRELTIALFHNGVMSRLMGNEEQFLERAGQCVALAKPRIEYEYYLARHELDLARRKYG